VHKIRDRINNEEKKSLGKSCSKKQLLRKKKRICNYFKKKGHIDINSPRKSKTNMITRHVRWLIITDRDNSKIKSINNFEYTDMEVSVDERYNMKVGEK
jgi:predicted RNase H-related nuclease YkuK (DUF458 family)